MSKFEQTLAEARDCRLCNDLHLGPRPVLRGKPDAKLMIISQAPGTKVHNSGISFTDRSGDRLREWLGIDSDTFYDEDRIAIFPMGLCYPGRDAHGGDLPPAKRCAPLWHPRIRPLFKNVELTLLVGGYGQVFYLKDRRKPTLTETVKVWRDYLPEFMPLPHPSWRNTGWLKKNPWFEAELLPDLRKRVRKLVG
jgi:uracil-DNA glycosylase